MVWLFFSSFTQYTQNVTQAIFDQYYAQIDYGMYFL